MRITSSFGYRSTALDVVNGRDLKGRNVVVTGGASGIGVETCRALAIAGADVTLAVRDLAKAEAVVTGIRRDAKHDRVRAEALDLASLASVRDFAAKAGSRPVHVLIANAGVMACPLSRTAEGFEMQLGTNHLGHFALAMALSAAFPKGARIVSLSSIGHRRSDVHFEDLNYEKRPYEKWEAYGQSKTANVLFAVGLTKQWASRGITANAVMPGGIMTGLQKHLPKEEMMAAGWMDAAGKINERFKTPAQGAATSVWAAVAPELEGIGGLYLEDCQEAEPWNEARPMSGYLPYARNPENAARLWARSLELIG